MQKVVLWKDSDIYHDSDGLFMTLLYGFNFMGKCDILILL